MTRRTFDSHTRIWFGLAAAALLLGTAFGVAGCEQATQVAPTSSVLTLTSASTGVDLNGTLALTATLTDSGGKAVSDGTLVTFASTLGTVNPTEARTANGKATTQLVAGTVSGTAAVTASSGSITSSALSVRIGQVPNRVALSAVLGALGSSTIVATVYDARGAAVTGVPVTFTTTAGSFGSSTVNTDVNGQATTSFYCTTDATITVTVMGVTGSMIVRPGGFGAIAVNITMAPANPTRQQSVTFSVTATATCSSGSCIARYEWEFSDGYVVATTGNTLTRVFAAYGSYAVTVRAIGLDGTVGTSRYEFFVN